VEKAGHAGIVNKEELRRHHFTNLVTAQSGGKDTVYKERILRRAFAMGKEKEEPGLSSNSTEVLKDRSEAQCRLQRNYWRERGGESDTSIIYKRHGVGGGRESATFSDVYDGGNSRIVQLSILVIDCRGEQKHPRCIAKINRKKGRNRTIIYRKEEGALCCCPRSLQGDRKKKII